MSDLMLLLLIIIGICLVMLAIGGIAHIKGEIEYNKKERRFIKYFETTQGREDINLLEKVMLQEGLSHKKEYTSLYNKHYWSLHKAKDHFK